MQASQKHDTSQRQHGFNEQPVHELDIDSYLWPSTQNVDHLSYPDCSRQGTNLPVQTFEQNCSLESFSASGGYAVNNSPSTVSFSTNESTISQADSGPYPLEPLHSPDNICGPPIIGSWITEDISDVRVKLRELETAMLGPDSDIIDTCDIAIRGADIQSEADKCKQLIEILSRGNLEEVLYACAKSIADNDMVTAEWLMSELRQIVSISGEPIQRLGAYMLEGLVARLASSGSLIYKALQCKEPASAELLSYMHLLFEVCPYFKFGYMSANGAIAEAMKDESRIHIIDFQIAQGSQWVTLIQALAAHPEGPPHVRITGIDDGTSAYACGGGLEIVGQRLSRLAGSYNVPFEFHAAGISSSEIQLEDLGVRPGEAIAVNFALMLHHMPDESVGTQNHRDRLLRLVKSLSPKLVTLVEQESNTNTVPFFPRFLETMKYYLAIFESIDVILPREHKERINVEQHCLAREIVNIVACEGAERVERHELLGKWQSRFTMAGFTPYPLSSFVNATIRSLLDNYCDRYMLEETDGVLYLGWMNQALVTACAWR